MPRQAIPGKARAGPKSAREITVERIAAMKTLRPFIPSLAAMLLASGGGASAQGVLIEKSEICFSSKQKGTHIGGRFRKWKANVDFRPKQLAKSKAELEIELASIDLANEDLEAEIKRPIWFDTAQYPVARFSSSAMKALGGDRYEVSGQLSLKGITREVIVPIALKHDVAGNSVAEGQFTLNRSDFKLGEGLPVEGSTKVASEVAVRIRMVLPPVK
jgi:polyisoprenoid-binding protein YceI